MKERKGFTLIELLVVIAIVALLMSILVPALNRAKQLAIRVVDQGNMKGLGNALAIYASENEDLYARAGLSSAKSPVAGKAKVGYVRAGTADGEGQYWSLKGSLYRFDASDRKTAFRIGATVTSSLYLLVKHSGVTPTQFVCKGDSGATTFKLSYFKTRMDSLFDVWDFGGGLGSALPTAPAVMPGEYCSYAYHIPYLNRDTSMSYVITENSSPGMPMLADRNPFFDKNAASPQVCPDPTETGSDRLDNSMCHDGKGQNVLFKDNSVNWYSTPNVGLREDHIYTYGGVPAEGGGDRLGTPPVTTGEGGPLGEKDAFLVVEKNYPG